MKTNKDRVVEISVMGEVSHPLVKMPRLDGDGNAYYVPSVGGITYNFSLGDPAFKPYGDHIEPDVSTKNSDKDKNMAYLTLSCIGNEAIVISGDAKGMKGIVIGKHGGIDHVIIHFPEKENLAVGDKILVRARGQGLKVEGFEDVAVYNIDPDLFEKVFFEEEGRIVARVTTVVPGFMMGSGIGAPNPTLGDYDINTRDRDLVEKYGIDKVRIGDFVAIDNHDCRHGLGGYKQGFVSVGVVVHSNCVTTGHGPGVTVVLTGPKDKIKVVVDESANLKNFITW